MNTPPQSERDASPVPSSADLVGFVGHFLGGSGPATLAIPLATVGLLRQLGELLDRAGVRPVLAVDSEPEPIDYVAQTLGGAAFGAPAGALAGLGVVGVLSRLGYLVPGVGLYLTVATAVGVVVGAAVGFSATRAGLLVRFRAGDRSVLELTAHPVA